MPYYITKEIINKQISNIFTLAKAPIEIVNKIDEDLINFSFNVPNNSFCIEQLVSLKFEQSNIFEIADLLFQVKDYKFYLSYILQIFLNSMHYNEICMFIGRTFVNHIGDEYYVSKDNNYEFSERYFDRFIEAVKFCKIDNFKILPFLFEVYKSEKGSLINKYYRPAKEFLKYFIATNEGSYLNYINNEKFYFVGYKIYCELFPSSGAKKLIENLIAENYFDKQDLYKLFLVCGSEGLSELRNYIIKSTPDKQKLVLNFYLNFGGDVKSTLPELYEKVENEQIKSIIKDEINLSKNIKFNTISDFINFATLNAQNVEAGVSVKYLTYLKNGTKASDEVLSYVFNIFKNITSPVVIKKYKFLSDFFPQTELDNLGLNLINSLGGTINNENKWVCAFVVTLCSSSVVSNIIELVPTCLANMELSSFVLGTISQTTNVLAVNLIKQLYLESNNKQFYFSFLEMLAENAGISALDYLDEMVPDFGLNENCERVIMCNGEDLKFEIDENLSVKVKNLHNQTYVNISNTNFKDSVDALKLYHDLTFEIMEQISKFKQAYLSKRMWLPKVFVANILSNPLLKKIARTLVFGVYDKDNLIKIVDFNDIDVSMQNYKIALVHVCELTKEQIMQYANKFEPFRQMHEKVFVPSDYDFSKNYSSVFNGVSVFDVSFNNCMRTFDYKMSISNGVYYYKAISSANLLVKVEIEKTSHKNTSIIGNIMFYNLNQLKYINSKYIIGDNLPEQIGSINLRTYSTVISEIYECCFK